VGPGTVSGVVVGAPGESWKAINHALALGLRGLPGDSSLAELLAEHRGAPLPNMSAQALADKIWAWEQEQFPVKGPKRRQYNGCYCPLLNVAEIRTWADAHRGVTGTWPTRRKGRVQAAPYEVTWNAIDQALRQGLRGLGGGSSLSRLLDQHKEAKPPLTHEQIMAWADAYHAAHRRWPTNKRVAVDGAPEETWSAIDQALRKGGRGLSAGTSLSALLIEHRGPEGSNRPRLTLEQVRAWANAYQAATGKWPTENSGPVQAAPYQTTWKAIAMALKKGGRGLPRGFSLARLRPGSGEVRPQLTHELILTWADAQHAAQGSWPSQRSGKVLVAPSESWAMVDYHLRNGGRGLTGGSCLGRLFAQRRGMRNNRYPPNLTIEQILAWADDYHAACGLWPGYHSGPVNAAPGETWKAIDRNLWHGRRGLPGGTTLLRLLVEHRGPQARIRPSALNVEQILAWAEAHHSATSHWPDPSSGPIVDAPGEDWSRIDTALQMGSRGLAGVAGGTTLPALLDALRSLRNRKAGPRLSIDQIFAWADAHHLAHGSWPDAISGPVAGAPGETWLGVAMALFQGDRGLGSGCTLRRLLAARRPRAPRAAQSRRARGPRTKLTVDRILAWAQAHRAATGRWPQVSSGPVTGAPGGRWNKIDYALRLGRRGLPGGLSLAQHIGRTLDPMVRVVRLQLTVDQILTWADAHRATHGRWPAATSDSNAGAPGEIWKNVDSALRHGNRGLPGGLSLRRLFVQYRSDTDSSARKSADNPS
jgi:hypothetical protein